ncbi:hypothetical protein [Marilutibacter chinensis]|uniref:Lipoprotein n=1 Tax=Marilutibacter chinensis TaxID=2912247 RepID=A0ABS9HYR5_9GAMM|nr:hypothetical protein [Lysobacter chinensis]MCF7223691.1 hypothetical protein [Lysobacter chinensis]
MKPVAIAGLLALLTGGCASVDYYDTNAAVDARPECTGMGHEKTGEPVPAWCEREQGATWSGGADDKMEVDFSDGDEDGR